MTWLEGYNAVRDNVRARFGSDIAALETMAREFPLDEADGDRRTVANAIEAVLKEAHMRRFELVSLAFLLDMVESGIEDAGVRFVDRVGRAVSDAADAVIESRLNSPWAEERDPVTTYEAKYGHGLGDGDPSAWRAHYRAHWLSLEAAAARA